MKQILMIAALICTTLLADAQTRRIAHRFHSGSDVQRCDGRDGNYGIPYVPMKYVRKVDTITEIHNKDTVQRLVDSSYYILDTSGYHQSRNFDHVNDVREYGKICSRFTGE